jgi:hypothetical protein
MRNHHTIELDEGQRQMVLLALAKLSIERPGWLYAIEELALTMDNTSAQGKPELLHNFRRLFDYGVDHDALLLARELRQPQGNKQAEGEMKSGTETYLLGLHLLGNRVRFRHLPPGTGVLCTDLHDNGMVEIEGLPGQFAPHLFEIDGEVASVMGTVE